ncbi:tetratricopeptide repeat protein [Candidatus Igneacidithiobacillus taiwanensis]|uniref:tetratricopeptide repeat protein n=1 Tax=Candidatus Igneacidithiobacillus taiwanensis TaxID=1945924 RepID=UPI00289B11EB|nr:tetratricopeptide repeat protein [Candidatus Igneacidithiobacillus taiwanensis]
MRREITLLFWLSLPVLAHASPSVPQDWWKAPGSLASDDAQWRAKYLRHKEDANAFAADLQQSQKTGKGMAYLDQGGVSPSWYKPPIVVQPFPGAYSAKLYDLAYSAFLQSHRLQEAYRLAYTAVLQRPDDRQWRQRLIQVSLWLGQREQALTQWTWLAQHGDAAASRQAITLAVSLSRPDLVVQLLSPAARAGTLSDADWKALIFAYGELGEPDKALADIDAALQRGGPRRYLLEQKAYLSYQLGQVHQSLAALQRSAQLYGSTPHTAVEEARLLSMQGNYRLAFQALEQARASADLDDVPFWQLYALLAWEIHDDPAAFAAEKTLYLLGAASQYDLQRLVLLSGKENAQAAMHVAEQGWQRYHLPLFYFEAIYYAGAAQEWQKLGALLQQIPPKDPDGIRNYTAYWMAMGQWASSQGNYGRAGHAYAEALRRNPEDELAQSNLLWMLIDHGRIATLRALLVGDTLHPAPGLREVVANALERIGQNRAALFVHGSKSMARDDTPQALLQQAGLWAESGSPGLAWSQRRLAAWRSYQELERKPSGAQP